MNTSIPLSSADIKELTIKSWTTLEPEAICKDVATKGKHIQLCINYLAKRLNFTTQTLAKEYFHKEVTKYVKRLLSDRQVFKAEHVLLNVERVPKFVFYEYAKIGTDNEMVRQTIINHLQNKWNNFDEISRQMDIDLKLLHYCEYDPVLHGKYSKMLQDFSLETFNRLDGIIANPIEFRSTLATEIFFQVTPNADIVEQLDKLITWKYLFATKSYQHIRKWLQVLQIAENSSNHFPQSNPENLFNVALENVFAKWILDEQMIAIAADWNANSDGKCADEGILMELARCGVILSTEIENVRQCLHRIFTTESWHKNAKILNEKSFNENLIKLCIDDNRIELLAEDFIDATMLQSIPTEKKTAELDLCIAVKNSSKNVHQLSAAISKYLLNRNNTFYTDKPLVYLFDMIAKDHEIKEILAHTNHHRVHLNKIPFTRNLLVKLDRTTTNDENDQTITLMEMIKRFCSIDLSMIRMEADAIGNDAENLNFANVTLIEKYARPARLDYIHYVRQRRSAYAAYIFMVDQLSTYSQLSPRQIIVACADVAEIAAENFTDTELVTHCMAFIEMLGMNSSTIRAYIKCMHYVHQHNPAINVRQLSDVELMRNSECALLSAWVDGQFNVRHFDAMAQVYKGRDWTIGVGLLEECAKVGNWFQLMLVATYFQYSVQQVIEVCDSEMFRGSDECSLGRNLARAVRYEITTGGSGGRRNSSLSYRDRRKTMQNRTEANSGTSGETMSSSVSSSDSGNSSKLDPTKYLSPINPSEPLDLFAIILQCICTDETIVTAPEFSNFLEILRGNELTTKSNKSTALNLICQAIAKKWPLLAILAGTIQSDDWKNYCWIIWLMTSMDMIYTQNEDHSSISDLARWLIEHSITNGFHRTLDQSFRIFFPENIFAKFTAYLSQTCQLNFSTEITDLLKTYLITLNNQTDDNDENDNDDDDVENGNSLINDIDNNFLDINQSDLLTMSINLLIRHINNSFSSSEHQIYILQTLCESGISDFIIETIDLHVAKCLLEICRFTSIHIDIEQFARNIYSDSDIRLEYERICEQLIVEKEFGRAMKVADLLTFPKDSMVYESWIYAYESNAEFDFTQCEREIDEHSLGPELVIGFYLYVADRLSYANIKKYRVLKRTLDVIKRHHLFPNESFDRDRIEYEMLLSFLKNRQTIVEVDVYHAEYFETIMVHERKVLYKSFMELKEMACIDELTVVNKRILDQSELDKFEALIFRLLDEGDIVQALRIQAMFNHRPIDLHYLVFCMALAEGLASVFDLTYEQREMLSDDVKSAASRFDRRTLNKNRLSQSGPSTPAKTSSSPHDAADISGNFEFEEIPSREKQMVLDTLQCFAAKNVHGNAIAQRIAMVYRAALFLDKEYVDVLKTKDPFLLLQNAIDEDCLNKLIVMNDIMQSMKMTNEEIANFLAQQIATSIIRSRFYLLQNNPNQHHHSQTLLWGYDLDKEFRMFLELSPCTSLLGTALLQYCDALKLYRKFDGGNRNPQKIFDTPTDEDGVGCQSSSADIRELFERLREIMDNKMLSHKKQNTICVELIIKAHDCFVHECYMEGIALVLQRAKILNQILENAKSWNLIVKMLMGIGRYRDMYYCFETLIANEQFESLLGQFDEDRVNGLKQAIITYLHENCPDNKDHYRLAALHFMMYKELAEMWESEANAICAQISANTLRSNDSRRLSSNDESTTDDCVQYLMCGHQIAGQLQSAMEGYAHAAENYLLDNKLGAAHRVAHQAELIALQINLNNRAIENNNDGRCICVLSLTAGAMRVIVNYELSVPQSQILGRAYPHEISWTDAIFNQYIIGGNVDYLNDFCQRMELTEYMIETIVKTFQHQTNFTKSMEQNISTLIEMIDSVALRYKLASILGLKKIIANLINDQSVYYLKDTNYGRNES